MEIKYNKLENILLIKILSEIDHHTCEYIKRKCDDQINKFKPKKVIFDLEKVEFMDSSGIGMLLGRYKNIIRNNGTMGLTNLNKNIKRIFEMTGIFKIIAVYDNYIIDEVI